MAEERTDLHFITNIKRKQIVRVRENGDVNSVKTKLSQQNNLGQGFHWAEKYTEDNILVWIQNVTHTTVKDWSTSNLRGKTFWNWIEII